MAGKSAPVSPVPGFRLLQEGSVRIIWSVGFPNDRSERVSFSTGINVGRSPFKFFVLPGADAVTRQLTAIIQAEDGGFVALCPELDICSQGETVEEARENLREALELFFECASPDEVSRRLSNEVYVTQLEVAIG